MSEHEPHRICLACADRPFFTTKFEAYLHARGAHPLLLDEAHPDELFELRGPYESDEAGPVTGPFCCLMLPCDRHTFTQEDTVRSHLYANHDVERVDQELGVHYCAERDRDRVLEARDRERDALVAPFARRVESLYGVRDFLMECGL